MIFGRALFGAGIVGNWVEMNNEVMRAPTPIALK